LRIVRHRPWRSGRGRAIRWARNVTGIACGNGANSSAVCHLLATTVLARLHRGRTEGLDRVRAPFHQGDLGEVGTRDGSLETRQSSPKPSPAATEADALSDQLGKRVPCVVG
jgi:hypothetical protein